MKLTELRKVIREEVREAIQEELKDILLEAVRSPKPTISSGNSFTTTPVETNKSSLQEQKEARSAIMNKMMMGNGNMNLTSADVNTFQARPVDSANGQLPEGNVGLDAIMGLMNNR